MAANESVSNPSRTLAKVDAVEEILVDAQRGKANTDHSRLVLSSSSKQLDDPQFVSTISGADLEPIVTRKELWSYYRGLSITFKKTADGLSHFQYTIMAIMYVTRTSA